MRRWLFLLIFLCVGCSKSVTLNCSYTDINSIYGVKKFNDTLVFKDDELVSFRREINFNLYSDMIGSVKNIYKSMKNEGIAFKKSIGGKYSVSKSSSSVTMILKVDKFKNDNLNYIGVDVSNGYNEMKTDYKNNGFSCK